MLADSSNVVREFVYAGFSPQRLIATGIVLAVVVALLTWWELRRARPWLTPVLVALRWAAVAVVLWMLAEPTLMTTVRHSRSKSVAVLVDASASMGVTDPGMDDGDAVRWAATGSRSPWASTVTVTDGAAVAVQAAWRSFGRFRDAFAESAGARRVTDLAARAKAQIDAATESVAGPAGGSGFAPGGKRAWAQIHGTLADDVGPKLADLADDAQSGRLLLAPDRMERVDGVAEALERVAARARRLADEAVVWYAGNADSSAADRMQAWSEMSRNEKTAVLFREANATWLQDLDARARLLCYRFDGAVLPVGRSELGRSTGADAKRERAAGGMSTDLAAAMQQIARGAAAEGVEAAVLCTDGAHNTEGDPTQVASALSGLPFIVVPIGSTEASRDVVLHHVHGPRTVFLSDRIVIDAMVDAHECAGETLRAELVAVEDSAGDGVVIDTQEIVVASETFSRRFTFEVKAERLGMHEFRVRVAELPDERSTDNNTAKVSVEVTEDKIRVLLVDYFPRWEFRYLRNLFKRDDHIVFDEYQYEPPSAGHGREGETPRLPADLNAWSQYRVVVLGDLSPAVLTAEQQDLLGRYVGDRGGTLLLIAGQDAMPGAYPGHALERMLPVDLGQRAEAEARGGYELFRTAEGAGVSALRLSSDPLEAERIWREQLPVHGLSEYAQAKPTAHVLIGARPRVRTAPAAESERAFLCWHQHGRGRVLYLAAPVTYRLRFRTGDQHHHGFWGNLLRWAVAREIAVGSKTVRLVTDKTRYQAGDDVQVTVRLAQLNGAAAQGADCRVVGSREGQVVATLDLTEDEDVPGTYTGVLKDLPVGSLTLTAAGDSVQTLLADEGHAEPVETFVTVEPEVALELRNTRCNLPLLTQVAELTGGMVVPPSGLAAAVAQLDLSPVVSETVTREAVWPQWMCLWIFLGCLTVEWSLRKLTGLA